MKYCLSAEDIRFKYILCIGSTEISDFNKFVKVNLNTSYVLVQLFCGPANIDHIKKFLLFS